MSKYKVMTLGEIMTTKFEPIEYIVEGVVTREGLCLITGIPGCTKTFMAQDMAYHVAHGLPWMGRATMGMNVLYVSAEGGVRRVTNRFQRLAVGNGRNWRQDTLTVIPQIMPLDTAEGIADYEEAILNGRAGLGIIDTMTPCLGKIDGDKNAEMAPMLANLAVLMADTDCAIMLVHHNGKASEQCGYHTNRSTYSARGASCLPASVTSHLMIDKTASGVVKIVHAKSNEAELAVDMAYRIVDTDGGRGIRLVQTEVPMKAAKLSKGDTAVVASLKELGGADIVTGVLKKAVAKRTAKNERTALRDIDKVVADGLITKVGRGKYSLSEERN